MKKKKKKGGPHGVFREYFELIAETAIFVFFVMTFVVQAFQIPTGSMETTLLIGDFLLVNKLAYARTLSPVEEALLPRKNIERNDIVVFKYPRQLDKDFVKRVIAVEGDQIEIRSKQVYINSEPVKEDFKFHRDPRAYSRDDTGHPDGVSRDNFGPVLVPEGYCFVMGDNRDDSLDSRYWGFLPLSNIKGRPWMIYFSYDAERDAYLKTSFRDRVSKIGRFFRKARWKRLFKFIY